MNDSNIQQKNNQSDEIDIFEFCSRIWQAFKKFCISIKDFFVSILIFLIKKSLWIAIFAVIGVIAGSLIYTASRPFYSSSLEGYVNGMNDENKISDLNNTVVIDHINKLKVLSGKPKILANYLGMTEDQAKEILSIKAFYGIDVNKDDVPDYIDFKETYNPKDTNQVRVPSYIYLKVSVYNENIFPALRRGLLQYVNNNSYIQELYKITRKQKEQYIAELQAEINKIDSLQRSQYRQNSRSIGEFVISGNKAETRLFYRDVLDLHKQKQTMERELTISDDIIVVTQDFTPLAMEEHPLNKYVIIFCACGSFLGLVCSLLWQYRKTIWALIKEDASN